MSGALLLGDNLFTHRFLIVTLTLLIFTANKFDTLNDLRLETATVDQWYLF